MEDWPADLDTREHRRRARALLLKSLPRARALVAAEEYKVVEQSAVGAASMRHFTEDNMAGVIIVPGEYGGWCADVVLKNVPPGVANSYGTPVRRPHRTRAEAIAAVPHTIAAGLTANRKLLRDEAAGGPRAKRVFEYFGIVMPMSEELLDVMQREMEKQPERRWGSRARAVDELLQITEKYFPDAEPTIEAVQALSKLDRAWLMTKMSFAMMEGVFRYPGIQPEPPARPAVIPLPAPETVAGTTLEE